MKTTDTKQAEQEKYRILQNLTEQIKLSCLYKIDEIIKKDVTTEDVLKEIVQVIPSSWQYPEIAASRILIQEKVYKTENFAKTDVIQKAGIIISGEITLDRTEGTVFCNTFEGVK